MRIPIAICSLALGGLLTTATQAQNATIQVDASQLLHSLSSNLTGACLEDVNHEVYGGIYSQMIFGESFQEPPQAYLLASNFANYAGSGTISNGDLTLLGGAGPKLIYNGVSRASADVRVQLQFSADEGGDAGVIFQVSQPSLGADSFNGYEVSLAPSGNVVLGRHQQDWEPISQVSTTIPIGQWVNLEVQYTNASINVLVNGSGLIQYTDTQYPLTSGQVGLRNYQQDAQFQNFYLDGTNIALARTTTNSPGAVSGMWTAVANGSAVGQCALETTNVFVGSQSQRITFDSGVGEFGVANQGLNLWGMDFIAGHEYDGCLDVRADEPVQLTLALESASGSMVYAETNVSVTNNNWQRVNFSLSPSSSDPGGRFAILLTQPGSVVVGYAFLQPGAWGQFQGLPVRKDVAQGLINQGITVLRYGGSMVNAAGYRWKNMIGPRDQRPPYAGTWYPYSSDGWGIPDFLDFCEAAGFLGVPDFNINETPQDMADFMQYVNGPTNTIWGAQRAADGHPKPYHLKYLELGNEQAVNTSYAQQFQALAPAIWAADSNVVVIVGDFEYTQIITNPFSFGGAASGITTLAAQQQILQLADQNNREVWFDVHVWDDGPTVDPSLTGMFSYDTALNQIAGGANYKVVVFELNADHHDQGRALGNALAINAAERDGRLPIVTSANCLQPDGENNNGWDQGLLFLNPSQVWLQPPGYVTQMYSQNYLPLEIWSSVTDASQVLDASAERSPDGSRLVLKVVNIDSAAEPASINLFDFAPTNPVAMVEVLSTGLTAENTALNPSNVTALATQWPHNFASNTVTYSFAPYSVTTLAFQGKTIPKAAPVLKHRYSFDDPLGSTTIADSVGHQNGTFYGSSGGPDGAGNLILNGTNGYVSFGPDLITGYTNLTVESWMNVNTNDGSFARLFDFGATDSNSGLGAYGMDFCPNSGGGSWFEVFNTDPGVGNAQQLPGTSFAGAGLTHVVVVYDPQLPYATVYTNGVAMGMASINIPISSLQDVHNYLGRSGYNGDPCLNGTVQEFRIYAGDMSGAQVAADYRAGPHCLDTNFPWLTSISLAVPSPVNAGQIISATVTASYQNAQSVNVGYANPFISSGNINVLQVASNLTLTAISAGTTTVIASYGGLYATQSVTVLPAPLILTHRYKFNEPAGSTTFTDAVGVANGTVNGSATLDGNNLVLPGGSSPNNNNYGSLPGGLIADYTAVTFECWVTFGPNAAWGRLIDIGDTDSETGNGAYCIDFTPHSGYSPNGINFEVADTDPGFNDAQQVATPPVLDNLGKIYLALVYNPPAHSLAVYTNGTLLAQNNGITIPMSSIHPVHCYLGKSSYAGDPNGTATLDELRIYDGAMSASQVAADYVAGPNALPGPVPLLSINRMDSNVMLSWPTISPGYILQMTTNLNTGWINLNGMQPQFISNGNYEVFLPLSQRAAFYRLTD